MRISDWSSDVCSSDLEQAAFSPASVVPGIGFSPDRMLQGRIFAYHDAHLYRIGTNYQHLPVNRPQCPYPNYKRAGAMRFDGNGGGAPVYAPNSIASCTKQEPTYSQRPLAQPSRGVAKRRIER